jgi:hypothetical protein
LEAVAGWVTALEMRAERAERAAATAIGVGAVLFQGLVVGVMVVSVFGLLIGLVETYL